MPKWMKTALWAAVVLAAAYGIFVAKLGNKTFYQHALDVWRSPVMQEKINSIEKAAPQTPSARTRRSPNAAATAAAPTRDAATATAGGELTAEERRSLEALISKMQKAANAPSATKAE